MQSDLYCCNICCIPFDKNNHVPRIIPICSHMLCSACLTVILNKSKRCPFDNSPFPYYCKQIEDFPKNLHMLECIEAKLNIEYGFCDKHRKIKDLVCVDDKVQVCEQCIPSHNNHQIKSVHQLKTEAQTKKKKLKAVLEEFKCQKYEIRSLLKDLGKDVSKKISGEFEKIRDTIKLKEREILAEVDSILEDEKTQVEDVFQIDETLVDDIETEISDLENNVINKRFLKTLAEPIKSFQTRTQLERVAKGTREIEAKFSSRVENFRDSVVSFIEKTIQHSSETEKTNFDLELIKGSDKKGLDQIFEMNIQGNILVVHPRTTGKDNCIEIFPRIEESLLNEITTFRVEFYQGNLTEQHIEALKHIFTSCKKVSQLDLWFSNQNFTDNDMDHFCSNLFWTAAKIESLTLNLKYSQVSDVSLSKLIKKSFEKCRI